MEQVSKRNWIRASASILFGSIMRYQGIHKVRGVANCCERDFSRKTNSCRKASVPIVFWSRLIYRRSVVVTRLSTPTHTGVSAETAFSGASRPKLLILRHLRVRDAFRVSHGVLSLLVVLSPSGLKICVGGVTRRKSIRMSNTCKSPEFPRRNAKTRWGEPAGPERCGHVAVTTSMEAGGIEPPSCCS